MPGRSAPRKPFYLIVVLLVGTAVAVMLLRGGSAPKAKAKRPADVPTEQPRFEPRKVTDTSGFMFVNNMVKPWGRGASLQEVARVWAHPGRDILAELDRGLGRPDLTAQERAGLLFRQITVHVYDGRAGQAYKIATEGREFVTSSPLAEEWLYTFVYMQGITALRRGEDENCILCRGDSSCIVPIAAAAVHTNPSGSRAAIQHFTEYLQQFPDDLGVLWLLNLAHMTLGEYPHGVEPRLLLKLDKFWNSEFDIGRFRDVGALVGINRLNISGGAILEDFDGDGLLDIVFTTLDPTKPMVFFRNKGDGTFEDRTKAAGLLDQLGGLNCVQADYNNDGHPDIFVIRGAWLRYPIRPSLLRNNGDGTFTDVTDQAGLSEPVNSIAAQWADFDNDGHLDLFVGCETGPNKLYRNRGDGTFEETAERAGVAGRPGAVCKGAAWLDFDNDGRPDLFLNFISGPAKLFRNNGNGTFADVTTEVGIDGPEAGFSCWAWDFDNDGFPDIFATSYARTPAEMIRSLQGQSHGLPTSRLYRNLGGKKFQDVTKETGLDGVYVAMGSNFGDFDNDGCLDFYLGTGDPNIDMLVPNRMFKNVGGKRFAEITASSGTGHLQKGHGVAIGDWDRNGTADLFIQMGGAIPGDKYHNILFQNPGQGNNWLNVKLVGAQTKGGGGKKTNRAAIGARIRVVTAGPNPLTVYRTVSSGSSFGANPLEQHIGLGKADRIALLEVHWPTSGTTQTFRDIPANQALEITEFAPEFRKREYKPIPLPK